MAIVKMSKFDLYSFDYDREKLLEDLQKFNYVHIDEKKVEDENQGVRNLDNSEQIVSTSEKLTKVKWAIDLLEKYSEKHNKIDELKQGKKTFRLDELTKKALDFDFDEHYKELSSLDKQLTELDQNNQTLNQKKSELTPWENLDLDISKIDDFKRVKVVTGTVSDKFIDQLKLNTKDIEDIYIEEISRNSGFVYLLVICKDYEKAQDILRDNGFVNINIKANGLVKDEIRNIDEQIIANKKQYKEIEDQIKSKTDLTEQFKIYHDYLENNSLKEEATSKIKRTDKIDIIEGYVPTDKEKDFENVLQNSLNNKYYLEMNPADKNDPNVPIILKNRGFAKAFESITGMYSLPKYNEVDPTPLLAPFYCFFSGMMIGDLGYGLIVFLAILVALKIFNLDEKKKQFLKFFMFISIASMFWGYIYGSFFGGIIPMTPIIDTSKNAMTLIVLCLIFGFIHLFFALGIKAYMLIRDHKPLDAFYDVGLWYLIIISILVLLIGKTLALPAVALTIAKWIAIASAVGIVLTAGRDAKSIGGKLGSGLYSLYGISGWIGDFVSYMRLMALGLSGAYIAVAINMIVKMMAGSSIIGFIFGLIVFVVFQAFNAFLSYLSAYVHSARLIFVEMFNKFYEGGGVPFKKLITESEYFNITNK
ncbi:V-type ATP synthase subunit I [Finegoldia magna]|uniref:V-type ATP synthase subunit I n=2 Tax=Finegoldia magna TaxID=1260 RepID=A0A6N2ZW41_FINMA|nr:V-type ATP synthase subunit I [Finegoldia magna]MDU4208419.1 V-type ATP synthase subunit I [Finegoldia magna]MDU5223633.1 V-type ATP synthase subunit I [Finegoldia magna]